MSNDTVPVFFIDADEFTDDEFAQVIRSLITAAVTGERVELPPNTEIKE